MSQPSFDKRSGYDSRTGIYHPLYTLDTKHEIPTRLDINTASLVLSQFPQADLAEATLAFIDSGTNQSISYALYHSLEIRKGDVVLLLSPNSILYPSICLAVLSIGAILTTANPLNTESEIAKQVHNLGAKLAIAAPEELHKLVPTGVPTLLTTRPSDGKMRSVEELIKGCYNSLELPQVHVLQSDTAAILYSSGTTGVSKGVVLAHANLISVMRLLSWSAYATESQHDVFLAFLPMFHIYGLVFFGLGLLCIGVTTIMMQKFDFQAMLVAIQKHKVTHLPSVPPVVLALVKYASKAGYDLSNLRRVGTGAASLSKEVSLEFRKMFPWVELRQGYGLTESTGPVTFFPTMKILKLIQIQLGSFFQPLVQK
ncbi:putative AMP-dependent synthetase/ligase [Lupinus albus]|uniref:Putative AMP-dependent synthetase/ligase n=1 Tax=Lupinus albus TaxID=3870 RepID=A0A6A4R1L0_LUPAL|nr:putative AMP-dependent synthetase/ligase [Lupinus albus]